MKVNENQQKVLKINKNKKKMKMIKMYEHE